RLVPLVPFLLARDVLLLDEHPLAHRTRERQGFSPDHDADRERRGHGHLIILRMQSLWKDDEARQFKGDLGLRVYTSRLLGRDKSLVLHGGGNTPAKNRGKNLSGGEEAILCVKARGWGLERIEPQVFSPVRLAHVLRLSELPSLSDPEMVDQLVTNMLRASAPAPSIETILHGLMPAKFVDHTHADAVLSVTNTKDGEKRIREIYGRRCVVIPYLMPGFDLAQF